MATAPATPAPGATTDLWENPLGTDGFEFIEYAAPDPAALGRLFEQMGFTAIARHRSKDVLLYRQGGINFVVNAEPASFAQSFARVHGPSICAIAFRVRDAARAYRECVANGAWGVEAHPGPMELAIPAIKGIGDSLIYLVDRYAGAPGAGGANVSIYDIDFVPLPGADPHPRGAGLTSIDHLTHNVYRGRMEEWASFYARLFNFREVRYFDIEGKLTGLKSKAMTSPCGKIRIPINESSDDKSQIHEYLVDYRGEGIQHVALAAGDIHATVEQLRGQGVAFQDTPDTYYEQLAARLPGHREDTERLRRNRILLDGRTAAQVEDLARDVVSGSPRLAGVASAPADGTPASPPEVGPAGDEMLLQIFTKNVIGPIFFELIQRKGNQGFGEGNFRALFESIELDQIRRGVLKG
ncbi:MAG TPA: 4-hydroxyphenylpyruvate dioxygenase [Casimicrobiaceae bacterium]|nr:4-hydroxyphenylpyruvate dioxygenase [Casimicrobiaceae bacterium]